MTDYDFRNLSPIDFESLVRDLLQAKTGHGFATFAVGPDGGIDCRYVGEGEVIVAQCKHRPDAKRTAMVKSAKAERERIETERDKDTFGTPSSYYFVTSAELSPQGVDEVAAALGWLVPDSGFVWTRGRLNSALAKYPDVERRHFKLWMNSVEVFDRIVGAGEWERNDALVRSIQERVQVWVHTPKYGAAMNALADSHVVIISGAPGVGKSTLAEMLLLTHWEAGYGVVKLTSDVADAWKHVREGSDDRVIFYYDDFLGQTSTLELQKNESSDLGLLIRTLGRSASDNYLLVMTTREQILNAALSGDDDRISLALDGQERIRVELSTISRNERAQMLVNHLYFAYRSTGFLSEFAEDDRYLKVIDHRGFNPRILESVVVLKAPPNVSALYAELLDALDHPDLIWAGSFRQLSALASRIVLILAIEPGRDLPVEALENLLAPQDDPRGFTPALRILEETWIRIDVVDGVPKARLYDPSRRDYLLEQLVDGVIFTNALRHALTLDQLNFLLSQRLRGGIVSFIARAEAHIRQRAKTMLDAQLQRAERNEQDRQNGKTRYSGTETYVERMLLLATALDVAGYLWEGGDFLEAIRTELDFLDEPFDWLNGPTSTTAFALADVLNSREEEWAKDRAEDATLIGINAISDTNDFREFTGLDWDLRQRTESLDVTTTLSEALHSLLANVANFSSPSSMLQEIDEIESIADELQITIDTSSEREYANELPEPDAPPQSSTAPNFDNRFSGSNSNKHIASIFGTLKIYRD